MYRIQKGQNLTVFAESILKDAFGVFHLNVKVNSDYHKYSIPSEFAVRKALELISNESYERAISLLNQFAIQEEKGI